MSEIKAVIQAGGQGTRLYPYSTVLPKALMPIGEGTVADKLIEMFVSGGVKDVYVTLSARNKISSLIESYCGSGSRWGVNIHYVTEDMPLGTIGPLNLMRSDLQTTFMVTNSDVALDMDVTDFIEFHRRSEALLTIAVAKQQVSIEYGVIENDDGLVHGFREKPTEEFCVSTGVYCMEPRIFDYIPESGAFGFDGLIDTLLSKKERVLAFDRTENWIDIGRIEDLRRAQENAAKGLYKD